MASAEGIIELLADRTRSDEIIWKAMGWRDESDIDETAVCWRTLWYDCEIVLEYGVSTGRPKLSVWSPSRKIQGVVVLDEGDGVGRLLDVVHAKPHEKRLPKEEAVAVVLDTLLNQPRVRPMPAKS